jgi:hypothetical protein
VKISPCQSCGEPPHVVDEVPFVISCTRCKQRVWGVTTVEEAILDWNRIQRKRGPMTEDDFTLSRFLFSVACESDAWAETARRRFDDDRDLNDRVSDLEALAVRAKVNLQRVCGRPFNQISDRDLDASNPAPWTQFPYNKRSS